MKAIYDYRDYRLFLKDCLPTKGIHRGRRAELAKALNCQPAFISQVLNQKQNLSFEMALAAARFLNLNNKETDFFLNLVSFERAGNKELRDFYKNKMTKAIDVQSEIKEKVKVTQEFSLQDQVRFFSSPLYNCVLLLAMIKEFQDIDSICARLKCTVDELKPVLQFLEEEGFITKKADVISSTSRYIHVDRTSAVLNQFHSQWRLQSMNDIHKSNPESIHFTSQFCCSKSDFEKIKKEILGQINSVDQIIDQTPKNEDVYAMNIDLFSI